MIPSNTHILYQAVLDAASYSFDQSYLEERLALSLHSSNYIATEGSELVQDKAHMTETATLKQDEALCEKSFEKSVALCAHAHSDGLHSCKGLAEVERVRFLPRGKKATKSKDVVKKAPTEY